ncbi:ABC-ATPase domain-containing protein, partial [Staphylococcus capitis]|uniref:ABC-ATPase domain-containing protein n=1 Tax=Staphylococcus capitis TaxID=29388 RepID=UPI003709484C
MEVSIFKSPQPLQPTLNSLDAQKYPPYKRTKPLYQFHQFTLPIHHLQLHPFPPPSKITSILPTHHPRIPHQLLHHKYKPIPLTHFLTPPLHNNLTHLTKKH